MIKILNNFTTNLNNDLLTTNLPKIQHIYYCLRLTQQMANAIKVIMIWNSVWDLSPLMKVIMPLISMHLFNFGVSLGESQNATDFNALVLSPKVFIEYDLENVNLYQRMFSAWAN